MLKQRIAQTSPVRLAESIPAEEVQLAPAIEVPMYFVYASIPLGMAGMGIRAAINLARNWPKDPSLCVEK